MKFTLSLLVLLSSASAFSYDIQCSKGTGDDDVRQMSITDDKLRVSIGESEIEVLRGGFEITSTTGSDSMVVLANNSEAILNEEGKASEAVAMVVFVMNGQQRAGRLTVLVNGDTYVRNELITCQ